ncbi:MAG TPA: phosphate signaling complex protein PhoU [Methylomusa anaerophila]|uniref:Phosphate-specific transport system accessory protein PhoU n=1 Tax=Methylomusa anaerophila TaxID=1930071 RepID=A0A348ALI5_9FIRM|nr:phosphate signaling complex protein PhoU [Methylomusa anaerophila]BBB91933.1 phosphate-specific transport system accessory protein PhoU [Methylomusa anaerophila]HML88055.1 phosphate signaling complex protein PhoU [Methylomusa anaerophila]
MLRVNYLQELSNIKSSIINMGDKTTTSVLSAVESFITNDTEAALRSRRFEKEVDRMFSSIDEQCITTIATQQPAATDLRFLISSIKIAGEIERVADYANNIAKIVQKKFPRIEGNAVRLLAPRIKRLGNLATQMLTDAIHAYRTNDANLASQVWGQDAAVNQLNKTLLQDLVLINTTNINQQEVLADYNVTIRYIERVADRATNIAEAVFYIATGYSMRDRKEGNLTAYIC